MKKIYWQLHNLPRAIMIGFCLFVLVGLYFTEHFKQFKYQPYYKTKLQAAKLTQKAFDVIQSARKTKRIPILRSLDPEQSGLIGKQLTQITSDSSQLNIKQMTINPNIAALFVEWLKKQKLKEGDVVAVNMTGSFPALDIAMLAAIQTLKLKPLLIFSSAASQYGANIPYFSWLDMYHVLVEKQIFSYPILGVALGGRRDNAYTMDPAGVKILKQTIDKYHFPFIDSTGTIDGINKRMQLYETNRNNEPISAFINVGGGMTAIGLKQVKPTVNLSETMKLRSLQSGIVDKLPVYLANTDSVAVRFLKEGVTVINVHNIGKMIIKKYQFPSHIEKRIPVGVGKMFYEREYSTWIAMLVLFLDVLVFIFISLISKKYRLRYTR